MYDSNMKKSLSVMLAVGLFLASPAFSLSDNNLSGRKIVIDAGHGGTALGSTECPGLPEKDATLDIAFRLKALLEIAGATAYMTRTDDRTLSNADRYNFANSTNGEVLVSIHLNGSTNHAVDGTQGLYGKRNKDLEFTKVLHNRLAAELGVPDNRVTNFASGVLLKSNMPATIQETVFISNTTECGLLTDGTGNRQQAIAQSLFNGLNDWFGR